MGKSPAKNDKLSMMEHYCSENKCLKVRVTMPVSFIKGYVYRLLILYT